MGKYWEEMKEWKICENDGCGMLFETIKDMEKHMFYHCGKEGDNPSHNHNEEGAISRKNNARFWCTD